MLVRDGTAGRDTNKISYNVNHAHTNYKKEVTD
jgi:hypothetical protein